MGNAAIAFDNLIDSDDTTITAASELASTPANTFLKAGAYEHVLWRWMVNAASATIIVDFGAQVSLDTIALIALTGEDPDIRYRFATADPTGIAANAYDSDSSGIPIIFDPDYLECVHLLASPATGRYLRIDVDEVGVTSIGLGRLFAGLREVFGVNFAPGWSRTPVRRSVDVIGDGGQTFIDRRRGLWTVEATFGFMSEADRTDIVEAIDVAVVNEGHRDFLWIKDVESTKARDFLWGYKDGDQPVSLPFPLDDVYETAFRVRQRL